MMIGTAIRRDCDLAYAKYPYSPSELFPELHTVAVIENAGVDPTNKIYSQFRNLLVDLECDIDNFGTKDWNPLGGIVNPGDTVIIKPNLVGDVSDRQDCITTHPSLIRPIIDYTLIALDGNGSVIVGDAPGAEAKFEVFQYELGYQDLIDMYKDSPVSVEFRDFRALKTVGTEGIWTGIQENNLNDKPDHIIVNLGEESVFYIENQLDGRFHGGGYEIDDTIAHHHGKTHEYCVSKDLLQADVLISVPKLKTHKKAGVTCCLKNLVGINCDKNYLPHFIMGPVNHGGDEMPQLKRPNAFVMKIYNNFRQAVISKHWLSLGKPAAAFLNFVSRDKNVKKDELQSTNSKDLQDRKDLGQWLHSRLSGQSIAAGSWPGNQTICRMILDLNRIVLCSDKYGNISDSVNSRKLFYVVDGVVAGTGNGPLSAIPSHAGIIAAGYNGLQLDTAILRALGINPWSIPLYDKAKHYQWMYKGGNEGIELVDGDKLKTGIYADVSFQEPDGWLYERVD